MATKKKAAKKVTGETEVTETSGKKGFKKGDGFHLTNSPAAKHCTVTEVKDGRIYFTTEGEEGISSIRDTQRTW